jgi:hypothetical protein
MKKITFSADEDLIAQARLAARIQGKTLKSAFREWLVQFADFPREAQEAEALMKRLRHVRAGHSFTRDEMNLR